jgi:hypothetical protein
MEDVLDILLQVHGNVYSNVTQSSMATNAQDSVVVTEPGRLRRGCGDQTQTCHTDDSRSRQLWSTLGRCLRQLSEVCALDLVRYPSVATTMSAVLTLPDVTTLPHLEKKASTSTTRHSPARVQPRETHVAEATAFLIPVRSVSALTDQGPLFSPISV